MVRVGLPIAALLMALFVPVLVDRTAMADEAEADCPPLLARQLPPHAVHTCRLLRQGRLESGLRNSAVVYRLYRWTSAGEAPNPRYDAPPYNQLAVTLRMARRTADFWAAHYWLAMGWFEPPRTNAASPSRAACDSVFVSLEVVVGKFVAQAVVPSFAWP